jgi:tetratricopeptide (TPR) repeat protein
MSLWVRRFRIALYGLPIIALTIAFTPVVIAGESEWVEVKSPHFSVVTDAGEKRGREAAMRFEQMRSVFGALITKANVNLPVPLQIVAFRNTKEMRQVAPLFKGKPTQVAGLFQSGSDRSFIMLDLSVENPWAVVFHEYAHELMNGNLKIVSAPWFEEGFAEYFSSIEVDSKEARVGKVTHDEYVILQQLGMMKVSDLFRVQQNTSTYNESGDHRTTFYAESGMLMHYIYDNQLMLKVGDYFDLQVNKHLTVEEAIQKAFGMSAAQLDKALQNYAREGRYRYYPIPTSASISPSNYTVTTLSSATGNAVLADIHLHSPDYQKQALTEFQNILKSDPKNVAAYRGLGYAYLQQQDFAHAAEYFRQAAQLDSKDPRVHSEETGAAPAPPPTPSGPAKFLTGKLVSVDCTAPPLAILSVVSGTTTWKMKVADRSHVVLIGADNFSCDWNKQKVALNYRETSPGEGSVISLEIQ